MGLPFLYFKFLNCDFLFLNFLNKNLIAICSNLDEGELRKSEYWDCNRDAGDDEYEPAEFTKS